MWLKGLINKEIFWLVNSNSVIISNILCNESVEEFGVKRVIRLEIVINNVSYCVKMGCG